MMVTDGIFKEDVKSISKVRFETSGETFTLVRAKVVWKPK